MEKKLYDMMDWAEIEDITYAETTEPQKVLGPRKVKEGILIQAFVPEAKEMWVKNIKTGKKTSMQQADEEGFYACLFKVKKSFEYKLIYTDKDDNEKEIYDPYLYTDLLGGRFVKRFNEGIAFDAYKYLGARETVVTGFGDDSDLELNVGKAKIKKKANVVASKAKSAKDAIAKATSKGEQVVTKKGVYFAVWAPNAMRVSVVGDFNEWDDRAHQMMKVKDSDIFEIFIPELKAGISYKFSVKKNYKEIDLKTDPYAYEYELRPKTNAIVSDISGYKWGDASWLKKRKAFDMAASPVNIYEMHLGAWEKDNKGNFLNYKDIAKKLVDYLKSYGFTHVELMPVFEHPLDESKGFQATGYFAPTKRYGSPLDFMFFVDYLHKNDIGVILDFVPASFPDNKDLLSSFSSAACYEYEGSRGVNNSLSSKMFDLGKPEVNSFLISSAKFFIDSYHVDGFKVCQTEFLLYLDAGRSEGEWAPNIYGGRENLEGIEFVKKLSKAVKDEDKGIMLIAQDYIGYPEITGDIEEGGLGFDYKWNLSWQNSVSEYFLTDPLFRKGRHDFITSQMDYEYTENHILPLSHELSEHSEMGFINYLPGDMELKYANFRNFYGFMMLHPGKKTVFMGNEFGNDKAFDINSSLNALEALSSKDDVRYRETSEFVKDINSFYLENKALYEEDFDVAGFNWVSALDYEHSVISFVRNSKSEKDMIFVVVNFTPVTYDNFLLGVPKAGTYKEVFNSDRLEYGGTGHINKADVISNEISWDGKENSISILLPPLSVLCFKTN
ncbi:MAG: 1,4-alpha-glucan branching protein GlgB [Lachnospiraceae bacterium]|nr:1,4-alpha-glucan branching protein GlgB [Lachnospiraceae bacterium]